MNLTCSNKVILIFSVPTILSRQHPAFPAKTFTLCLICVPYIPAEFIYQHFFSKCSINLSIFYHRSRYRKTYFQFITKINLIFSFVRHHLQKIFSLTFWPRFFLFVFVINFFCLKPTNTNSRFEAKKLPLTLISVSNIFGIVKKQNYVFDQ